MTWIINHIDLICSLLAGAIGVIGTIVGIKFKGTNASKVTRTLLNVVKRFPDFIRQAEKVSDDAEEKKTFVLDQAILNCKAEGVILDEKQLLDLSERVDATVQLSKQINLHSKTTIVELPKIGPVETIDLDEQYPIIEEQNNEENQ